MDKSSKKEVYQSLISETNFVRKWIERIINNYDEYIGQIKGNLSKLEEIRSFSEKDFKKFLKYDVPKIMNNIKDQLFSIVSIVDSPSYLFSVTMPLTDSSAPFHYFVDVDTKFRYEKIVRKLDKLKDIFYVEFGKKIESIGIDKVWHGVINQLDELLIKYFLEHE